MALHTETPIYKVTYDLLDVVTDLAKNMPRDFKASIGGKLRDECIAVTVLVFRANVAKDKLRHLDSLVERQQVLELLLRLSRDKRLISTAQYARAIQLAGSIGNRPMAGANRSRARSMTVTAIMAERIFDLVVPLAHEATAMRTTDTAASRQAASGAVSCLGDRAGDVDSTIGRSTLPIPITPGTRTSTTVTRTTTTSVLGCAPAPSADEIPPGHADFSFAELAQAYFDCRETKRNTPSALAFEQNLERNLCDLYDELQDGSYRPGRSICFVITRPKHREVWAAQFRDRIVHHLLYNKIGSRFEAGFVADSCACIPGRGTLYAAKRLEAKVRSITQNWREPAYYLKCDLANFFVSINKHKVARQLARRIREPWWLRLAETILFHDPREGVMLHSAPAMLAKIPPHKSLFNQDADHGLPIGNLSSQFFANVFLDEFDQHCKHDINATRYIRYVDDFVLLHADPQWLRAAHADIATWLPQHLGVRLNPVKTVLQSIARGIDFAGQVIRPHRRTLRRRTYREAINRCASIDSAELYETANSYFGLLRQTTRSHTDRAALANLLRHRGHTINRALTQTYRKRDLNAKT